MPTISKDAAVRVLTIIFTPVAGGLAAWAAKQGVSLPNADVITVGVTGSVAVLTVGLHWLAKQPAVAKAESDVEAVAKRLAAEVGANPELKAAIDDLGGKLEAHTSAIVDALGKSAGLPSGVLDTLKQAVAALEGQPQPALTAVTQPPVA